MKDPFEDLPPVLPPLSQRKARRHRVCAISRKPDTDPTGEEFPHLHLQGNWLKKVGFVPGTCYTVEATDGDIRIRRLNIPEPMPPRYQTQFEDAIFDYGEACLKEGLRYEHPGTLVMRHFLIPMNTTIRAFAAAIEVKTGYAEDFLRGRRPIDGELARRIGRYTGTSSQLWIELQIQHELGPDHPGILGDPEAA
jgi:antitoxin HigA-1